MKARCLEELLVFNDRWSWRVQSTAILDGARSSGTSDLRDQLRDACDSIVANIAEGFPQPTDRAFANYLFIARASSHEVRARLLLALQREYATPDEVQRCTSLANEVERMATGLIKHLRKSNRRNRGLGPEARTSNNPDAND